MLEDRLRKLEERYEAMDRRHADEYRALSAKYEAIRAPSTRAGNDRDDGPNVTGAQGTAGRTSPRGSTSGASSGTGRTPRESGGIGAQGTDGRAFVREYSADEKPIKRPAKVSFSEGLEFSSEDDEFKLTFHDLTQAEYRAFPAQDRGTLQDQFFVPRQRWYFTGQATQSVEFYTAINRGYGSLDLLDAFITLNLLESLTDRSKDSENPLGAQGTDGRVTADRGRGSDNRLRFRVGRMKTPYLYEYFSIAEGDLIAPERSLYAGNLAGNRQDGAMILGELFKQRIGYAGGVFNGPRRSFGDSNASKDVFLYLNTRPFLKSESLPFLNYLNLGGSVNGGSQRNAAQPRDFETANDETANGAATGLSPTFLSLNSNVIELGHRTQWAGHAIYYYKSLMLLGEYGGGSQGYSINKSASTQVPFHGWMVQGTYFLTGEQLTRRVNVVRPRRNFGYNKGQFGLGAFEVHARFSDLELDRKIFTAGFADPNLWSNRAYATDVGVNWYWNFYTKIYFDWQHAMYGQPVTTGAGSGRYMSTTDLFWLRFQLFF